MLRSKRFGSVGIDKLVLVLADVRIYGLSNSVLVWQTQEWLFYGKIVNLVKVRGPISNNKLFSRACSYRLPVC